MQLSVPWTYAQLRTLWLLPVAACVLQPPTLTLSRPGRLLRPAPSRPGSAPSRLRAPEVPLPPGLAPKGVSYFRTLEESIGAVTETASENTLREGFTNSPKFS